MECPVCFEPYDLERHRPKVLVPCGHSVCLQCLLDPAFGKQCPQDRTPIQGELAQLPDCMTAIHVIVQGDAKPRSAFWCRDCEKDFTDDCSDAGHRSCSQRQLRAERIASRVQTLERGAAAGASLKQHLDAVSQGVQLQMQAHCLDQHAVQTALAKLQAAAKARTGLKQAMDEAEQLGPQVERLEEAASLAGLRGRCSVAVQAEDGAEWRASVALEDGKRCALRHALLWLSWAGDLTKVDGPAVAALGPTATVERGALSLASYRPEQMNADEMADFLQRGSLKQLRSLTGVDCAQSPQFCELLLQAVTPHLEELEMLNPGEEHMEALRDMPFLRKLSVSNSTGGRMAPISQFPVNLEELRIKLATLEHMVLVKDLTALRKLDIACLDVWEDAPDLPLQLEELTLDFCSKQHLLSIQRMPRLRRLFLNGFPGASSHFSFPPLPPLHLGLTWLKVASTRETAVLSLIRAHAATLREVQLMHSSTEGHPPFLQGLAAGLRGCGFPSLQRLVLLRRAYDTWRPKHAADCCRRQVHELQDALLRRDAASGVRAVRVVCDLCDEGLQL